MYHQSLRSASWNNLNSERQEVIHRTFLECSPYVSFFHGETFLSFLPDELQLHTHTLMFKGKTVPGIKQSLHSEDTVRVVF